MKTSTWKSTAFEYYVYAYALCAEMQRTYVSNDSLAEFWIYHSEGLRCLLLSHYENMGLKIADNNKETLARLKIGKYAKYYSNIPKSLRDAINIAQRQTKALLDSFNDPYPNIAISVEAIKAMHEFTSNAVIFYPTRDPKTLDFNENARVVFIGVLGKEEDEFFPTLSASFNLEEVAEYDKVQ